MATKNLKDWRDEFLETHVQPDETTTGSNFLSGESVALVSGPADLENGVIISSDLVPVGMVQNAQVSQGKQIQQLFEIGSRKPFFVPGRTQVQASISRILFDGPSLFYVLYRSTTEGASSVPSPSEFGSTATDEIINPTNPYPEDGSIQDRLETDGDIQSYANPGRFWSNLRSEIFNKPMGLGFVMFDMEGDPYGGLYLEQAYIRNHNMSVSAQQTILLENVSIIASQVRPLSAESLNT